MQLELDERDAALLWTALRSHIDILSRECARTDLHALQHDLALVVTHLEVIATRLEALRARQPATASEASAR